MAGFQGLLPAARSSLLRLHGHDFDADEKIQSIEESLLRKKLKDKLKNAQNEDQSRTRTIAEKIKEAVAKNLVHFKRPEVLKPFLIILLLSVIQQFSGMSVLRGYVVKIFGKIFSESPASGDNLAENFTSYNFTGETFIYFNRPTCARLLDSVHACFEK